MLKKEEALEFAQPLVPTLPAVQRDREARAKESAAPELGAWQTALDDYASRRGQGQALPTLDLTLHDKVVRYLDDKVRWFLWPPGLYIPGSASAMEYWPAPCPADHRYSSGWKNGPGSDANVANPADGHLFAYAAARVNDVQLHSEAGLGFFFTPSSKLATYRISPSIAALGQYRWDTGIARDYGGNIRLHGFLYTAAWLVSPVDGSLSLVSPYGLATVFDHTFNNQGGIPITAVTPPWNPGPPPANVMLEGSRTYLISVIAAVQIDNGWTDGQGKVIPSLPPEAIWKVWCSLDCNVSSIWIEPSIIYIP